MPVRPAVPPPAHPDIAARFEAALVQRIGGQRYTLWFSTNTVLIPAGRELLLAVSSEAFLTWLETTFGSSIRSAASEASDGKMPIRIVVDAELFDPAAAAAPPKPTRNEPKKPAKEATIFGEELKPPPKPSALKPAKAKRKWKSLADFVVGSSNRIAHASALSIAEEPGEAANPVVFHGPVGTGKTHLLEGVYLGLRKTLPEAKIVFSTAEEFTTRFVQACRFNKPGQFRKQFRDCDALILDDLQFLATKPQSQKEFLHTLDALVADGKQVVVTSDCHPKLADELLPELVDRLLGGAVWSLQPPDEATRLEILRKKSTGGRPSIPDAVLKYLAKNLKGNCRELEGAIHTVRHYSKVTGHPVDQQIVRESLGDLLRHTVRSTTIQDIDDAVCSVLRLSSGSLQSKARKWSISHPRMIAIYLARKLTSSTYGEIAKHFGVRTHSTAVASEKKVRTWLQKAEKLSLGERVWTAKDLIERIERDLQR